jgi:large subunit ribosomal protein L6e
VNHRYVIATSTVVDIDGVASEILDRVSKDEYWAREQKENKGEDGFFKDDEAPQKKETDPQRIEDQKKVDKAVLGSIRETPDLEAYLASSFSLRGNEKPHEMVF